MGGRARRQGTAVPVSIGHRRAHRRGDRDCLIEEKESELDLAETVRRSEQTAVEAAMVENANNLAAFLKSLPAGSDTVDRQLPP